MIEMIERVAKAIYEADDVWCAAFPWPSMGSMDQSPDNYRRIARAAVEAMREPTEEMLAAGSRSRTASDRFDNGDDTLAPEFTAMIDEALKK